jgi:hypothetical protein
MRDWILKAGFSFLFLLLFKVDLCFSEIIYNPLTKKPVYEYNGIIESDTIFKSEDFSCIEEICAPFNVYKSVDISNGIPLDGVDFYCWERGWNLPNKPFPLFTFMVKEGDEFIWKPFSASDIENILGI